jgi:hypothetical protein
MRRFSIVMIVAFAVVAFSSTAFARAATLSATGKVVKVDGGGKTLTVTTKTGDKKFMLGPNTKITAGAKTATAADLAGKTVKVTYTTADGRNAASKVTIASEQKAEAPVAKKVEKKKEVKEEEKK